MGWAGVWLGVSLGGRVGNLYHWGANFSVIAVKSMRADMSIHAHRVQWHVRTRQQCKPHATRQLCQLCVH